MGNPFTRDEIARELTKVGKAVGQPSEAFIVGGGAMVVHGFKESTPDLDLIVPNKETFDEFDRAMITSGYSRGMERIEAQGVGSMRQYHNPSGQKTEICYQGIGGDIILTEGIRSRAYAAFSQRDLTVSAISPEDLYVSKLVSGRAKDVLDTTTLWMDGLDRNIIESERAVQQARLDQEVPDTVFFEL